MLNQEQQDNIIRLIKLNNDLLNSLIESDKQKPLIESEIEQGLKDVLELDSTLIDSDFIKTITEIANKKYLSLEQYQAKLKRIAYQKKQGNIKNIKGYIIRTFDYI